MSQIQSGVDPTAGPDPTGITLSAMLERYLDARSLSEATVYGYRYNVDKYLRRFRSRAIADISRTEVRDLYDDLRKRCGQATASNVMRTLRAEFKRCGRPRCRCRQGVPHGPYIYRHWREDGRQRKAYVPMARLAEVALEIEEQRALRVRPEEVIRSLRELHHG